MTDNKHLQLNANPVVRFLQKPAAQFTREDLIRYVTENGIEMINFMYPAGDGKLKTLNFVINDMDYLETILTCGERVDGSSLFSFIEAGSSDLYVLPRYSTAFRDPFAEVPTLSLLCSFFDKDGNRLASAPDYTLHKACKAFRTKHYAAHTLPNFASTSWIYVSDTLTWSLCRGLSARR